MRQEKYQGWTNAQTWCVALLFDNDERLFSLALGALKESEGLSSVAESELLELARNNNRRIYATAPWAWCDGETLTDHVNWGELREHYQTKLNEGA